MTSSRLSPMSAGRSSGMALSRPRPGHGTICGSSHRAVPAPGALCRHYRQPAGEVSCPIATATILMVLKRPNGNFDALMRFQRHPSWGSDAENGNHHWGRWQGPDHRGTLPRLAVTGYHAHSQRCRSAQRQTTGTTWPETATMPDLAATISTASGFIHPASPRPTGPFATCCAGAAREHGRSGRNTFR